MPRQKKDVATTEKGIYLAVCRERTDDDRDGNAGSCCMDGTDWRTEKGCQGYSALCKAGRQHIVLCHQRRIWFGCSLIKSANNAKARLWEVSHRRVFCLRFSIYFAAFSTANAKTHINPVPMATAAGNAPPFPSRRLAIPPSVPMTARMAHTKTGTCRNSRMPLSSEITNASRPTNSERSCRGFFFSFICKIPNQARRVAPCSFSAFRTRFMAASACSSVSVPSCERIRMENETLFIPAAICSPL